MRQHPVLDLIALGIRQPWAELILRGIKTIEVRSLPTCVRGPVYLYASKRPADTTAAAAAARRYDLDLGRLPRGLLVGTVEIVDCGACRSADARAACLPESLLAGKHGWQLASAERLPAPLAVRFLPYGVWFYPFRRKTQARRRQRPGSRDAD